MEIRDGHLVALASELKLGDVVRPACAELTYDCCTVVKVEIDRITLFRPYVHYHNIVCYDNDKDGRKYSYLLKYIGMQEQVVLFTCKNEFYLLHKGDVKG